MPMRAYHKMLYFERYAAEGLLDSEVGGQTSRFHLTAPDTIQLGEAIGAALWVIPRSGPSAGGQHA